MTLSQAAFVLLACVSTSSDLPACQAAAIKPAPSVQAATISAPTFSGEALDVVLTAQSAYAWDLASGTTLLTKNAETRRPIASLTKLVTALTVRNSVPLEDEVLLPPAINEAKAVGADISLPVGHHATVSELLEAGLIASANDAMVALAHAVSGSEESFVDHANAYVRSRGLSDTVVGNATGLPGGRQFSTAKDVARLLELTAQDPELGVFLRAKNGRLSTREGASRVYETTNDLLNTYVPILAAKTGYTVEAGENLAIITEGPAGQKVGAVVLGSENRFQDMKVLVEWVWRNYTWQ